MEVRERILYNMEDSIVIADAISCRKEITKKIGEKIADYVIGLKENQETLHNDTELYSRTFRQEVQSFETLDKDHGRMEKRIYYLLTERAWDYEWEKWTNLNGIGMVKTYIYMKKIRSERISDISSRH